MRDRVSEWCRGLGFLWINVTVACDGTDVEAQKAKY